MYRHIRSRMAPPWHIAVLLALLLTPSALAAGARRSPSSSFSLPEKGHAAHCMKFAEKYPGDDLPTMCDEWEGAVEDLLEAVNLFKKLKRDPDLIKGIFGSEDALFSTLNHGISALRMNMTEWAAQREITRSVFMSEANKSIDKYATDSGVGIAASLVTSLLSFVPCLNEVMLFASGTSDVITGYATMNDVKSIEDIFNRGVDPVFLSKPGQDVKGLMDLVELVDFMENISPTPGMRSLGRMFVQYVSSGAASNDTFTPDIVRDNLEKMANVTQGDLEVYVSVFYDAVDRSPDFASALAAATVRISSGFTWIGTSVLKFGVHTYHWNKDKLAAQRFVDEEIARYNNDMRPYILERNLEKIVEGFTEENMEFIFHHTKLSYRIKDLISTLKGDGWRAYDALEDQLTKLENYNDDIRGYLNIRMNKQELQKYFVYETKIKEFSINYGDKIIKTSEEVDVGCKLKDIQSRDKFIKNLEGILEADTAATIQKIIGNVDPKIKGSIEKLLTQLEHSAAVSKAGGWAIKNIEKADADGFFKIKQFPFEGKRTYIDFMGLEEDIEFIEDDIDSFRKYRIKIPKDLTARGDITEIERRALSKDLVVQKIQEMKTKYKSVILKEAVEAETEIMNLALKKKFPFPKHKESYKFSERLKTSKRAGYYMATIAMGLIGVEMATMIVAVDGFYQTVISLAAADAKMFQDVFEVATLWREI